MWGGFNEDESCNGGFWTGWNLHVKLSEIEIKSGTENFEKQESNISIYKYMRCIWAADFVYVYKLIGYEQRGNLAHHDAVDYLAIQLIKQ